jgi:hypothetical protein
MPYAMFHVLNLCFGKKYPRTDFPNAYDLSPYAEPKKKIPVVLAPSGTKKEKLKLSARLARC